MPYLTAQYGSNARWLVKALREVPHQIEELLTEFSATDADWRPASGDWSAREIAGYLRDSEREDVRAVEAIVARDGAAVAERRAHLGPGEAAYDAPIEDLFWDFLSLRESLLWTLEVAGTGWQHSGRHAYRGAITLTDYLHEINERDLEAAWMLRKLRAALPVAVGGRRRRR